VDTAVETLKPKISILFPVFNSAQFLRSTLETVVNQSFKNWELLAEDGGSTDGTLEILHEYAARYPNIKIVSEPDENSFHAIDKARQRAQGDYLYFLCASDGYLDNRWFEKCMAVMEADPQVSIVWGIPFLMNEEGEILGPSFLYAHFLESKNFNRLDVLKTIFLKLHHPLKFLKKINPTTISAATHLIKKEAPPQKQSWFPYWLKTGLVFPDGNMCIARSVFMKYFPRYQLGSKDPGNFFEFYFRFNADGYLAWCLPQPANFGRQHAGQVGERVSTYNEEIIADYRERLGKLRQELSRSSKKMIFRDRAGNQIV